ncbi:hypothetical protein BCR42DRAFT_453343 [Absidia repens]|uniref:Uncharacterized protein n=1 Tax=Absidia repens TaxID=90262 RepID=A0A1X2IA40_9FUNG|nr:hypothetical protein BCR42DRAFT_453343 [Absidia repens]
MKKRPCYLLIFILLSLFTLFLLQHSQQHYTSSSVKPAQHEYDSDHGTNYQPQQQQQQQEQFLSYFPNGNFLEQMNSLRNGLKLALDTNRTLILPYLRLSKTSDEWVPFYEMAKRYQTQDKTKLYSLCNTAVKVPYSVNEEVTNGFPLDISYCQHLDSWTDIPWSTLFDLSFLDKHAVRVVERRTVDWRKGGGWMNDGIDSLMIMDPLTFWENGTNFDTHEKQPQQQSLSASGSKTRHWWHWIKSTFQQQKQHPSHHLPLAHRFVSSFSLQKLDARLIQFGSLAQNSVILTSKSDEEVRLMDNVAKRMVPNRLLSLKLAANNIVDMLGGSQGFTSFHLHLETLIQREVSLLETGNELLMDEPDTATNATLSPDTNDGSQLDSDTFLEMMNAIVFELLGDIPINQAVSVALPIQPSRLQDYLASNNNDDNNGSQLLDACVDYRNSVDRRYPVVYFVTDDMDISDRANLEPLLKFFPCLFTRNDLWKMNPTLPRWSSSLDRDVGMDNKLVDYDELLGPFLDILVADESYSLLEMPLTPLSTFIARQHHHK